MKLKALDNDELEIVQWSLLPRSEQEKHPLTPKKRERYERANVADNLMREHLSHRKVVEKLVEKHGCSDSTARRDMKLAQGLWGSRHRLAKEYMGEILLDFAMECMMKAGKERNWSAVARLLKETREIAGIGKPDVEDGDLPELSQVTNIQVLYLPEAIGATPLSPDERAAAYQRILTRKVAEGYLDQSTLAEFVDDDDAGAE